MEEVKIGQLVYFRGDKIPDDYRELTREEYDARKGWTRPKGLRFIVRIKETKQLIDNE